MTTQTAHPQPVGPAAPAPAGSATYDHPTAPLAPAAELALDGLPLLDHRNRERTIAPRLALRGQYLAFDGGDERRLLPLDMDITHIGRGAEADIRLDEQRVSRDHAILVRHGRHLRLLDNRSANGTFVNGRRIVATNIAGGDVIEVGPVAIRYVEVR
jgi:FHA domain